MTTVAIATIAIATIAITTISIATAVRATPDVIPAQAWSGHGLGMLWAYLGIFWAWSGHGADISPWLPSHGCPRIHHDLADVFVRAIAENRARRNLCQRPCLGTRCCPWSEIHRRAGIRHVRKFLVHEHVALEILQGELCIRWTRSWRSLKRLV